MKYLVILCFLFLYLGGCSLESTENNRKVVNTVETDVHAKKSDITMNETRNIYYKEASTAIHELQAGHYNSAIIESENILKGNPKQTAAISTKGMALALDGKEEEGIAILLKAYEIDKEDINIYYNLAIAYKLRGELTSSKEWFEKLLSVDNHHVWATYGIATIYADEGKDKEALEWLEKAIQLDSTNGVKEAAKKQDHFERFHNNERYKQVIK